MNFLQNLGQKWPYRKQPRKILFVYIYLFIYLISLPQLHKLSRNQCDVIIIGECDKKDMIVTDVKVLSQHLLGSTEESHRGLKSGLLAPRTEI
jgi:hypothetical protein